MHKVALNGFGRIGRFIYTSSHPHIYTESYAFVGCNPLIENNISELIQILGKNNEDHLTLVKAYKAVQKKYYPEKDIYKKRK